MSAETITYDLRSGLDLVKETFEANPTKTAFHIPGAAFMPISPEDPLTTEAASAKQNPFRLKKDGRALSVMSLQADNPDVVVFAMSWGANFEHPIGETMVASVAKQIPNSRILSWNGFGRGEKHRSDRINVDAIRFASRTGSFDKVGREYAERIKPLLEEHEHIDLIGVSEGARIILSAVPYFGRSIRNVVLLDPPGTLGLKYIPYARRFGSEKDHSDQYVAATIDPVIQDFVAEHHSVFKRGRVIAKDIGRGILLDHYYRSPKAMAQDGLRKDLELAAPHITGKLSVILPAYTRVNDAARVRSDVQDVKSYFKGEELALWTLPGSHAIINSGLMVEATLLAYALNH